MPTYKQIKSRIQKLWPDCKNIWLSDSLYEYPEEDEIRNILINDHTEELAIRSYQFDCDDFALFAKTCLDVLGGWYTNYLLLGRERNRFTHIVCFAYRGKNLLQYIDPVIIDGANDSFNTVSNEYKFRKII